MPEEVEGELTLGEEQVPQVWWKCRVDSSKDGNKVILEGPDDAFGPVATRCMSGRTSWNLACHAKVIAV